MQQDIRDTSEICALICALGLGNMEPASGQAPHIRTWTVPIVVEPGTYAQCVEIEAVFDPYDFNS